MRAGEAPLLFVLGQHCVLLANTCEFAVAKNETFLAGISAPMFFGVGSRQSLPSLSFSFSFLVLADAL
jgi:hypothetical protein